MKGEEQRARRSRCTEEMVEVGFEGFPRGGAGTCRSAGRVGCGTPHLRNGVRKLGPDARRFMRR